METGIFIGKPKPWLVVVGMVLVAGIYLFYLGCSLYWFGH